MERKRERYPVRAVMLGALLCALLAYIEPNVKLRLHTNGLCTDYINAGAVVFLFVMVVLITAVKLFTSRLLLDSGELAIIFSMLAVACAIPSHGLLAPLLSVITGGSYYANDFNRWEELILVRLPEWLIIKGEPVRQFYEQLPKGESFPLVVWIKPAIGWFILICAVYTVMISMVVLLYEQWTQRERLSFPLVRLPAEMARVGEGRGVLRSGAFWFGLGLSFLVVCSRALAYYFPRFPALPRIWHRFPLLRNMSSITVVFSFVIIGFSYLLSTRVLLSLWFFHLLMKLVSGFVRLYGLELDGPTEPWGGSTLFNTHINGGAMLALVLFCLWTGREHIRVLLLKGGSNGRYRRALIAMVAGLFVVGIWLNEVGMPTVLVPLVLVCVFFTVIGLTRIVVQAGVGFMCNGMPPSAMVYSIAGPSALGTQGLVALGTLYTWAFEFRTTVMASTAQAFRTMELHNVRLRIFPLVLAIVITLSVSSVTIVKMAYDVGGANLRPNWFRGMAQAPYRIISRKLQNPISRESLHRRWLVMGLGASVMSGLMLLNYKFPWFPLHYIGFPIADVWMMNLIWSSVFVAWVAKSLVLRYGGARTYSRSIPFALGLILGQILVAGVFMLVDSILGNVGHFIDVGLG